MKTRNFALLATLFFSYIPALSAQSLPMTSPESAGMSSKQLAFIDDAVSAEIARKQLPGAVVLIGRNGHIVFRKSYGNRAIEPAAEKMTDDTIFDMASVTKVVATATSVMILVERGQVRLADPVSRYIPEFGEAGKKTITVEQLLTHRSGLLPDNAESDYLDGKGWENIWKLAPMAEAGSKFIYSDVNYIVLGELVKRVSGQNLADFAASNIYQPLGMKDTGFLPPASVKQRIAPTEQREGRWMRGEVHDPRSYLLGGVAGHAGLFSTAADLALYCQMILNQGRLNGTRILSPMTVARMTEGRASGGNASDGSVRGIGWDIITAYSSNRGDLMPFGSFGHTGFTGTSLWIDPSTGLFVVFLSNRVHPKLDPKKPADVTPLRSRVATIAAAAINDEVAWRTASQSTSPAHSGTETKVLNTLNGIDVLARDGYAPLKGRKLGLITNHTGVDRDGNSTIDLLFKAPGVKLVALFSPEHGIRGALDQEKITNSTDEKTGLPIYSLYGETRQPTAEMLKGIDTLVFDIQDIGARFYTFISTLGLSLEAAGKNNLKFVVLDRVNPINGTDVDGPIADADKLSFIAYHRIPVRHGMTVGELAKLFNSERGINADLEVIKLESWKRSAWLDETGLTWINPSPNMRSLTEATLYPGIGLLETTNVSVGRGTDTPFEVVGAPYINGRKLAAALNSSRLQGVRFVPVQFTPKASVHKDASCGGVNIVITDRRLFDPLITGFEIAGQLLKMYPKEFTADRFIRLLVNQKAFDSFKKGNEPGAIRQLWQDDLDQFKAIRGKYLLY